MTQVQITNYNLYAFVVVTCKSPQASGKEDHSSKIHYFV